MTEDILNIVKPLIKEPGFALRSDTNLISEGLLDSLDILSLIENLEARFHIRFEDADLNPENFETLTAIEKLVGGKL